LLRVYLCPSVVNQLLAAWFRLRGCLKMWGRHLVCRFGRHPAGGNPGQGCPGNRQAGSLTYIFRRALRDSRSGLQSEDTPQRAKSLWNGAINPLPANQSHPSSPTGLVSNFGTSAAWLFTLWSCQAICEQFRSSSNPPATLFTPQKKDNEV